MGKRIAIIISIIIASVAAFTGGVFGVLALMGKFDEKIIYPTSLEFDANCKIEYDSSEDKLYSFVLHGYNNEDKNAGYAVNQKLCYLDIKDDAKLITLCHEDGSELKEKSERGNYYIVNCNEPIYYKVNEDSKVDSSKVSSSTFGCVSFTAMDSRSFVKTTEPFTIWIDRQVKGVYVDLPEEYGTEAEYLTTEGTSYKEILTVNVGTKVYFTFESLFRGLAEKTSASYSLCPIKTPTNTITIQEESVKVGEKIVEIYDKDFNKYENGIESENGDYIRYDKNRQCWYFDSELSGTGTFGGFKIAVFDTYDARTNYLAQQEASEQKDSPAQRISKMVSTNLEFKVESSNITDVKFNTTEIGLDLYADYMQITLNADRVEQGKTNRNLGLDIKESGGESKRYNEINFNSTLDDVIRTDYDEIRFVDNSGNEIIYDQSVGITLGEGEDEDKAFFYLDGQEYTIHFDKSNVTLPGDRKLVGNITTEDEHTITYTAKTGRVVLTKTSSTSGVMNVISVGSYLSFYYLNTQTQTYRPAKNFEYTATQVAGTQGKGKTWDVVVKTTDDMGEENEVLTLGLLMINSVDLDHLADAIPWWFKTTNVRVEPVDLLYKNLKYLKGQNIDLPVTYQLNGESTYDTIYSELSFDEIIAISPEDGEHWPSYTSCVFVTSVDNNIVETLPEYTLNLTDLGRNFVLVGHIENGHFVNSVKIKEGANAQTSLYVLQLKNKFGENTIQTIDRVIKGEETLNSLCGAVDISEGYAVRVSPKYELLNKEGLVAFTFNASRKELIVNGEDETGKPTVSVYAGNVDSGYGYTLTITTAVKGMINNIMNMLSKEEQERAIYFALNENDTKVSGINNIKIDSFDYNAEEEKIVVYFYTEDAIAEGNYFRLCFNYNGVIVKSNRIYILSTDATDIRFNDKNQEIDDEHPFEDLTALPTSIEEAESSDLYIKISVSMMPDYSGYKFTYSANGLELDPTDDATIFKGWFNANCTIGTKSGFVALPLIVTGHNFVYSVEKADKDDKDIIRFNYASGELKNIEVVGLGSAYIRIKSSISRYIKVVVELEENTNFNFVVPSEINSNNETSISTRNNITYEYNNGTTTKELKHSQFVTLSGIGNVQYGELGAKSYPVEATEDGYDVYVQFEDRKEKLLTITKDGGYWKFARTEYNPNSSLSLDVSFATLTNSEVQTSTLIFTSVVTIDYGTNWPIDEKTKTVNIFANTKINLFEEVTVAKKDAQFNGNPLFRVYNLSNGLMTVSVYVDGEELKGTSTYKFTEVGAEHKVEFKCGDESIACWNNIRVVPNLVMKAKEDVTLYSDSSFGFADLFTLKQYRTDLTYGSKSGNTIIMYTDENLADGEVETYEGLVIKTEEDSLIDKTTKRVGWIEEIDDSYGKAEKLTIGYYDTDIEFGSVDVTIKNQYTEQGHLEITEISTILAKVATDSFVKYNNSSYGVLKSIETNEENLKFEINASGEFVVTDVDGRNINTKYTPNYFLFTFYNGEASSNKLTYKFFNNSQNPIAILPYTPAFVEETPAVTLQYYGLIKDVLDLSTLDTNNVESILVTGASDTTAFVENFDSKIKNHGYTASTPSEQLNITFKRFAGDKKDVTIAYTITYKDGIKYVFYKNIVVENDQVLEMVYPFADLTQDLHSSPWYFEEEIEKVHFNSMINLNEVHYEPVMAGSQITFDLDNDMNLARALVTDRDGNPIVDAISEIKKVGRYDNNDGKSYYSHVQIVPNSNIVYFENNGLSSYTYIVFKVTTTSGNYGYYVVRVCNANNYAGVSSNNLYEIENKAYTGEQTFVDNKFIGTSLDDIGSQIKPLDDTKANNVKFYLLKATALDGTKVEIKDEDGNDLYNTEISKLDLSKYIDEAQFYTFTFGVVYKSNTAEFNAGRIVAYLIPTNVDDLNQEEGSDKVEEQTEGRLDGRYIKTLPSKFEKYLPTFDNIASVEFDANDYIELDSDEKSIKWKEIYALDEDFEFVVKYSFTNGMYVYVTYTYPHVEIDYEESATLATGLFDTTNGFVNRVYLDDMGWMKKDADGNPIRPYEGKIKIKFGAKTTEIDLSCTETSQDVEGIDGDAGRVDYHYANGKHYLEFAQLNQEYQLTYTIEFISLKTPVQKQISMLVLSSLSKTTDTGLSLTTKIVDGYNDKVGSQLKVEKTSADDCNYDKYVIYGNNYNENTGDSYTIYAAKNSTLYFDVDDASVNYLTCDTSTRPMALTGGTSTIDFVHLAKAYKATIKFYVQRNDSFYITKAGAKDSLEFGTNVAKTYGGLKVEYVGTEAQSELVASNSTTYDETTTTGVTIFDYFFKEHDVVEDAVKTKPNKATHPARIALLNTSGEVVDIGKSNLKEMGFETINNPNYINYSYGEAVSPKLVNNKVYLQFASVSETYKSTHIDLKNNAGVDVTYNFYVTNLAQGKEQANGYYQETAPKVKYGENYTTILVDDNDPLEEHDFGSQNILSIYDTNNLGFYVTGLSLELDKRGTIDKGTVITREVGVRTITYFVDFNNYNAFVEYNLDSRMVSVQLIRNGNSASKCFEVAKLTISAYTDSGLLLDNYEVMYYNYTLSSAHAEVYRYLAEYTADIENDIVVESNLEDKTGTTTNIKVEPIKATYFYTYDGSQGEFIDESSLRSNKFYSINGWKIKPAQVVDDANITLTFKVCDGDYYIGDLTYKICIKRNMEIIVNGEFQETGAVETDYKMQHNNSVLLDDDLTTSMEIQPSTTIYKSNHLDLRCVNYIINDNTGKLERVVVGDVDISALDITIADEAQDKLKDYVEIDGTTIKYLKDFAGEIPLVITYSTQRNGDYTIYWTIKVHAVFDFAYLPGGKGENTIVNLGGFPLESNTPVNLINTDGLYNAGIILQHDSDGFETTNPAGLLKQPDGQGYRGGLSYVIAENETSNYSASETYNAGTPVFIDVKDNAHTNGAELPVNSLTLAQTLPDVTMGGESYIVVYKIDVDYLGQTNTYYVSYVVTNTASIDICDGTADKNIKNVTDSDVISNNKLNLFGYTIDDGNISALTNNVLFKCGDNFTAEKYASMKKYYVRLSNMTGNATAHEELYYKIESVGEDETGYTYYIDLSSPYSDVTCRTSVDISETKLFNNELVANLDIMSNTTKIAGIAGYKDYYKAGFKLTVGNNVISSKRTYQLSTLIGIESDKAISFIYTGETLPNPETYFNNVNSMSIISDKDVAYDVFGSEYVLKQLSVKNNNTSGVLYNLVSDSFYALYTPNTITIDGTEKPVVITPKYDGRPSFIVKLSDGNSQFNLANKIKYTTCDGTSDGYISKFYDVNGNEITSIVPTWSEGEYTSLLEYKLAHKQEDYYDQPDCIVYLDDSHSIKVEFEVSWELPKDITVKFVTNTSEVPTPTSETVYYGDDNKYGDIFPDLEREGYTLDGWYLNKDFTGTKVTSDSVVKLTKSTDTTITLYAKWTKNS